MGGFFVSTRNAIIIIGLFVLIVVAVGLMAGLIREPCEEYYIYERDANDTEAPPVDDSPWLDPFLPTYLLPVHYDMWFYPDFYYDGSMFYGREDIEILVQQTTKYLLLHYKMMEITATSVKDSEQEELEVEDTFPWTDNQYWVVELKEEIAEGSTVFLHLEFEGSLNNGIVGYYKSNYTNSLTGEDSWLATTKFQPSDSRKAFPNFDEPRYKAQYTVTLRHWRNFTALGNMPMEETMVDPDESFFNQTTFYRTPTMSSYLVCFIVCDLEYKENTLANGKPNRVWATPDRINQTDYALDISKRMLDWMEVYFNMTYQLPKLDHVAVPDYPSGATEHWGLMTYRQSRLLYDDEQLGDYDKQRVATIVAHEITHNYFGNTITCDWWDQIWLNEAPARYYEHMAVDAVTVGTEEYMDMMNQFVVRTTQGVMTTDAGASSRPVVVPINNPDEATAAFDSITYDKGASMLRMMEDFLGDVFLAGMRRLLKEHEYDSVNTQDLWDALQAEADLAGLDLDIAHIMDPWIYQMGLPVVDITEVSGNNLRATQARFMNDQEADKDEPESPYEYKWDIPLTYQTKDGPSPDHIWMNRGEKTFPDPRPSGSASDWLKFNNMQYGFYRVDMLEDMWESLANQLNGNHEEFHEIDRSQIMDDAFNLARAGLQAYDVTLDLTLYLATESSYFPWHSAKAGLDYMSEQLYGNVEYGLWRAYVVRIAGPLMDNLTTEDVGNHMDKLNRNNMIDLSCGHGHVACIQNMTAMFMEYLLAAQTDGENPVPNNLKTKVYQHGMRATGGEDQWNLVWDLYGKATSGQEEGNLLYSLAQTDRPWLHQRYLDYCMDDTKIRTQDFFTAVNYLAANPTANRHVWDWTRANYDELLERFDLNDRYFGRMVPDMVSRYNTEYQLEEVEEFYAKYPEAGAGERAREQSIDSIKNNIAWLELNEETIVEWLRENVAQECTGACANT